MFNDTERYIILCHNALIKKLARAKRTAFLSFNVFMHQQKQLNDPIIVIVRRLKSKGQILLLTDAKNFET